MTDEELAGWARNWHWNDCAEDKPVDPSIYFRDMRMLKAFVAALDANRANEKRTNCQHIRRTGGGGCGDGGSYHYWICHDCGASYDSRPAVGNAREPS